jgi:chromate reductase, NAD(P)H dehydrogenase (quinone)
LAISGSLRAASSNSAVLGAFAEIAPSDVEMRVYDGLAGLPPFNPDLDTDKPPAAVLDLRGEIGACDGLLISSPEYAHGIPGVLKNALDWLVGSLEFPETLVALINPSPRSVHAQAQLREVLTTMSARLVEPACLTLDLHGRSLDAAGIAADASLCAQLCAALAHFADAVRAAEGEEI